MRRGRAEDAMPNHRRPPRLHSVLCAKALFFRERDPKELNNDRSRRRAELPRRSAGARFVAIRGRPDLHRGFGPARRRGRQGGEPEGRRARPHPRHRPQAGRRPVRPGPTLGDTGTGMLMAISVVSALYQRHTTGQGRRLQVAMQDAQLNYTRGAFTNYARTGEPQERGRAGFGPPIPPNDIYPCKPGGPNDWVYVFNSHNNPEHWRRTANVIGRPELADDPEYLDRDKRMAHADAVNEMVTAWTQRHTKHEAMKILGAAGMPAEHGRASWRER